MRTAALAGALALAGCTTVTRTALVNAPAASSGNATAASPALSSSQPGSVSGPVQRTSTGSNAGPASGVAAAPTGGGASANATTTGTTCTKPVKIGVSYSSDESAGLSIVGNSTESSSVAQAVAQQRALYQRAVDDLNAHGGLAGCKVVLAYHDFLALGSDGFDGESESECVDFAEDQNVFAVINTTLETKTLVTCLAQHHVVDLYSGSTYSPTPADYAQYAGYLYEPSGINPTRWGPFVGQLAAAGYFPKGAKVGILVADNGTGTNEYLANNVWKPRLEAMGITPILFEYSQINGFSDVSGTTSQFSSAVLQFKGAGVTDVMATPDNGDVEIFFTQVAQTQNYHPRYAFTSANAVVAWGSEPAGQRPGALDVSTSMGDLNNPTPAQLAAIPTNPARQHCDALYAGHTGGGSDVSDYGICDDFDFLAAGLQGASEVTPAALLAGVDKLTDLPLADGFASASFGPPDHYDGGTATRMMAWNESAQQWQFSSPAETVP